MEKDKILNLEAKLKYVFNNPKLLKMALTHKSYAYEQSSPDYDMYNERIEFLGDAILEHIISDLLFSQKPELAEGEMTKKRAAIVCEASLSRALRRINGHEYIYLGKCEQNSNGKMKDAIVADAFEAILGAIYIDGGYEGKYPFAIYLRGIQDSTNSRLDIESTLNSIGEWVDNQSIYPSLDYLEIDSISWITNAILVKRFDNGVEDYMITFELLFTVN